MLDGNFCVMLRPYPPEARILNKESSNILFAWASSTGKLVEISAREWPNPGPAPAKGVHAALGNICRSLSAGEESACQRINYERIRPHR